MPKELTDLEEQKIRDLLLRRRKIEAVKLYREATGCGLKEAKEAVDVLAGDQPEGSRIRAQPKSAPPVIGCVAVLLGLLLFALIGLLAVRFIESRTPAPEEGVIRQD